MSDYDIGFIAGTMGAFAACAVAWAFSRWASEKQREGGLAEHDATDEA